MRRLNRLLGAALLAAGGAWMAACSDSNSTPTAPSGRVQAVVVTPSNAAVRVGSTFQALADVQASSGVARTVNWSSADTLKARVSAAGVITGVRTGSVLIIAASTVDTSKKGYVQVEVSPAATVRSITLTPASFAVRVGEAVNTTVVIDADAGVAKTATYRTSDAAKASVSAAGIVTGIAPGTVVITAMASADTNQKASAAVTVTPAASPVITFAVTPAAATINPGESFTAVSTIQVSGSASQSVQWTSQDPTIATVASATGGQMVITGIKAGNVVIVAKPSADTSVARTIAVTVRNPQVASATILSVNTAAANLPVNPANVQGLINVIISVDPGDQQVDRVALLVDSVEVASQNFTNIQAGAIKLAVRQMAAAMKAGVAQASSVAPITLTLNTADYTASASAASPKFKNGSRALNIKLYVRGGTASGSLVATRGLSFNNPSGFIGKISTNGLTANDAGGLKWMSGKITVIALPLLYNSTGIASASISFPSHGSKSGTTVTFDTLAYQTSSLPIGDHPTITAIDSAGSALDLSATPAGSGFINYTDLAVRIDNVPPAAPAFVLNVPPGTATAPNGAWLNSAYSFSTGYTSGGDLGVGPNSGGVKFYAGPAAAADAALVLISAATGNALLNSADSMTYRVQARETDLVGNMRATNLMAGLVIRQFGIDNDAPNVAWVDPSLDPTAISDKQVMLSAGPRVFKLQSQDVGFAGNAASPVSALFTRNFPGATAAQKCMSTFTPATSVCSAANYTLNTAVDNSSALAGYFTFGGVVADRAGNGTAFVSRTVLIDGTAPMVGSSAPTASLDSIRALAKDNIDLIRGEAALTYNAAGRILFGTATFGTAFSGSPNGYGTVIPTDPTMDSYKITYERSAYRQITAVDGGDVPQALPVEPRPLNATLRFFDAASNTTDATMLAPVATAIQSTFTAGTKQINSFSITSVTPTSASAATGSLAISLQAVRLGNSDIQALIQRIDIYYLSGGTWKYLGSTDAGLRADIAGNSVWSYNTTLTGLAAKGVTPGALTLRAIAVDDQKNGLLSNANSSVTMN